jgi:hypothetical protein
MCRQSGTCLAVSDEAFRAGAATLSCAGREEVASTTDSAAPGTTARNAPWRAALRRDVTALLILKLLALMLLWLLFFSPAHRTPIDAGAIGRRLAVVSPPQAAEAPRGAAKEAIDD